MQCACVSVITVYVFSCIYVALFLAQYPALALWKNGRAWYKISLEGYVIVKHFKMIQNSLHVVHQTFHSTRGVYVPQSFERMPMGRAPYKSAKQGGGRYFECFGI